MGKKERGPAWPAGPPEPRGRGPRGGDPGKNGRDRDDAGGRVAIRLVCLHCRQERVISLPAGRGVRREVLWECFACQERRGHRRR